MGGLICLDQISKFAILAIFAELTAPLPILPFMDFTLIWNKGISYGLFASDTASTRWLLTAIMMTITLYMLWLWRQESKPLARAGFALIMSGAIGNIIDRLYHGAVVDFISLYWQGYYWYVFNLADIFITLGAAALIFSAFIKPNPKKPL